MFEFLCTGRFFPTYSKYSSLRHICHHFLSHYMHVMCVIPVSLFFGTNGCWSGETLLWDRLDAVQKDEEVGGVCAELTCGWSFGSCPHMAPEWNMRAPQSFLSIIALSSLQICRPESFTGGRLCVCACLRLTLPPTGPITLTPTADPNRADLGFSVSRRFIFVPSPSSSKPSTSSLVSHGFRLCTSPTVEGARARVKSSEGDTLWLVPR